MQNTGLNVVIKYEQKCLNKHVQQSNLHLRYNARKII